MHTGVKTHTLTHTYALIHLSAGVGVAHCRGANGRNDAIVNINIITHNSKIIIISNIYE